ncbi:MAG: peptidylprolyl isomerase [Phycisphaerales bacterium]|nr:hypothetical protein [Planctomycetota bacterium]MCH8507773.1 peptidylprolyl isomerase [Phycisphaerales bacterium]
MLRSALAWLVGFWVIIVVAWGPGCASGGAASVPSARAGGDREPERAGLALERAGDRAVVIDGSTIGWASLRSALAELGGAIVLEEFALDRALEREAARRGITVDEAAIRAEERALMDELSTGAGENRAAVLAEVRRSRGLGPTRYEALLRRNALLRALVRDTAAPSEEEIELARRLAFGETRRVRLFVSNSESVATGARSAVVGAPAEGRSWVFAERAAAGSSHPSAARGGLIERFHPDDPAYPGILGRAARALEPGGVSPVLATAAGYAVVMVEAVEPGRQATAAETERVERRVRQRKERLAMERLARELVDRARVSPVDPDLARAWRERR